jgi:ribonuclease E
MAEPTPVALAAAPIPTTAEIERAAAFVREEFVHDGEDPAAVLASGSARRRALDGALGELKEKAKHPSTEWRRSFSLLLGLERLLSVEEPRLKDGTVLSAHQVDALSGTLTALLAEAQRSAGAGGNGRGAAAAASPELLASAAILGLENGDGGGAQALADGDGGAAKSTRKGKAAEEEDGDRDREGEGDEDGESDAEDDEEDDDLDDEDDEDEDEDEEDDDEDDD